jgi:hypothetical protein
VLRILGRQPDIPASAQVQPGSQIADTEPGPQSAAAEQYATRNLASPGTWPATQGGTSDAAAAGNGQAKARPAITDRWRLTYTTADVPAMTQLGNQSFDHRGYGRPTEQTPSWVRIRAVVACDLLGETPGWKEMRSRFAGLLAQESIMGLIDELTDVPDGAEWRPRGTPRRSWLEADLTAADETVAPAASANLFLPEAHGLAGLHPDCAQLTLHVDFLPRTPISISSQISLRRPPYWRARFVQALALPGELAGWLEHQLGLTSTDHPAAESGIMLQSRQPLSEMIDTSGIPALSSPYVQNQFTGWAVADANGKTIPELASQMMMDLSERIMHLDGTVEQMSGQVSGDQIGIGVADHAVAERPDAVEGVDEEHRS